MIKTVIFDFDGTVADTMKLLIKLFNEVAENYKLPNIKPDDVDVLRNMSAKELMNKLKLPPLKIMKLIGEIQFKLKNNISEIRAFEGIAEMFKKLALNGVQIGIVTSNTVENVRLFLNKNLITEVDFVHGEKNLFGKGQVIKKLIKRLKLLSDEVVYVGDEVRDIEAARYAGVKVISVTWGFNSKKRLIQAKPDILINSPNEIYDQI